jgi:hypothetical protein
MDNQELTALAWRMSQPNIEPPPKEESIPKGIGGWLAFFVFQNLMSIPAIVSGLIKLRVPEFILLNFLSLSVIILVLVLLWKRSPLFFAALYAELAMRLGTSLEDVRIHWVFVHRHHYSLTANQSYLLLAISVISVSLWFAYFKRSKRVLATFGSNL